MSLLQSGLRAVLRLALELYYVDVQSTGRERVPREGPVVFAANHPSSIMDTMILGTQVGRSLAFLARSGLFDNPVVGAVLDRLGVIPVYRRQDGAAPAGGNEDAFRRAFEVLERGEAIGIFPEGQNAPEHHVRDIKTGVARIALGAEARNAFGLGVKIVPVGLNLEDRDAFLTRVLVRFGEPIDVREYRDAYREDSARAVRALTDRVQQAIREAALHIDDERNVELVRDVDAIYGGQLLEDLMGRRPDVRGLRERIFDRLRAAHDESQDLDDRFAVRQLIAEATAHFQRARPELVLRLRRDIRRYKQHLRQANLRDDFVARPPSTLSIRRESVKLTLYATLLAPIALFGLVHSFVPYRLTARVARRAPDEAMRAFYAVCAGAVLYPLAWAPFVAGFWAGTESIGWTIAYVASLPLAGLWYLRWRRQLAKHWDRIVVRNLFLTNRFELRALVLERERILMELEALRIEYRAVRAAKAEEAAGAEAAADVSSGA